MNEYIKRHKNHNIVGAIESSKSYISCALSVEIFNAIFMIMYVKLSDLVAEWNLIRV